MSGIGPIGRLDGGAAALRARLDVLTRQVSDGRKGPGYGDIAPEARRAVDLRADIARRETWQGTISRALARTEVTQKALGRLSDIATQFYTEAIRMDGTSGARISAVAAQARAAIEEVANLLNERHAGEYIFGGSDSANPPVPDPRGIATGGMASGIAVAVASLGGGNAPAVLAVTRAAAQSDAPGTTPFSAFHSDPAQGLGEPRRAVPAADGERVAYGVFANRNAAATSEGDTTGSWARDILRGLATFAALDPAQAQLGADFTDLVASVRDGMRSAIDALGEERGALGAVEQRLEATARRHSEVSVALTGQLAGIEEVDMAETISRLQATQTQLEASYRAISLVSGLTLTRFLA
jgi:flagellin-like hook-associated protein FlgL